MSLTASLMVTGGMQKCFNVFADLDHESRLLFRYCMLLEIKILLLLLLLLLLSLIWQSNPMFTIVLVAPDLSVVTSFTNFNVNDCPIPTRLYITANEDKEWYKVKKVPMLFT